MKEKNITKEIQQELEEITKSILSVVSVKEIFLFGSYANGTSSENSDFDIYVVIPDNSMRPLDAMTKINMAISKNQKRPVDILVGSQSDFKSEVHCHTLKKKFSTRESKYMPNEIYGTVKEWIEYADKDISSAKYLCSMHPKPLEIICYHCQQCAEKALKAFLIKNNHEVKRTHDLMILQNDCKNISHQFDTLTLECAVLKNYSVTSRYPYPLEISETDTENAIKYAEKILELVKKSI